MSADCFRYFEPPAVLAVVRFSSSTSAAPTGWLFVESRLLLRSFYSKARAWPRATAYLCCRGFTKSFVKPSRFTAGDGFLQCGQVVVTTCDQISLISSICFFCTDVFAWISAGFSKISSICSLSLSSKAS